MDSLLTKTKPKAIIIEIDGVLSDDSHRRYLIDCVKEPTHFIKWDKHLVSSITFVENPKFGLPDHEAYYAACDKDDVNEAISTLAYAWYLYEASPMIILTTNASWKYQPQYEELITRALPEIERTKYIKLFMRSDCFRESEMCPAGKCKDCDGWREPDERPFHEIKKEIYEHEIKDKYEVLFVLEKDPASVAMYKELGLKVLTC